MLETGKFKTLDVLVRSNAKRLLLGTGQMSSTKKCGMNNKSRQMITVLK
jgi:hypothetical protein